MQRDEYQVLTREDSKTGITLEDKGIRDEHGMEAISGIFSSPAKSPARRSPGTRQAASTVTGSDSMDTGLGDDFNSALESAFI